MDVCRHPIRKETRSCRPMTQSRLRSYSVLQLPHASKLGAFLGPFCIAAFRLSHIVHFCPWRTPSIVTPRCLARVSHRAQVPNIHVSCELQPSARKKRDKSFFPGMCAVVICDRDKSFPCTRCLLMSMHQRRSRWPLLPGSSVRLHCG